MGQKVVADGYFGALGLVDDGEDEVDVGVYQFFPLHARRAGAAGIGGGAVGAAQVACIGQGEGQFAAAHRAAEELCVGDTSFLHFLYQASFYLLLSDDVVETEHVI